MRALVISILQLATAISDVPDYGPVGQSTCEIELYHFATSYYSDDKKRAVEKCRHHDCDVVVKWTRKIGTKLFTAYDIGKFGSRTCPQNPNMKAEVVWPKNFDNTAITNSTNVRSISWMEWSGWSSCSKTCGDGFRFRTRQCPYDNECQGSERQTERCYVRDCYRYSPIWNSWSEWSDCSESCENGQRERSRQCSTYGQCQGKDRETNYCKLKNCAKWFDWAKWSDCSAECDGGIQVRRRRCSENGQCQGQNTEQQECNTHSCVILTKWSNWSNCSKSCGNGLQLRTRNCSGRGCNGQNTQIENQKCYQQDCVNSWSSWSQCSVTCGQGTQRRSRTCQGNNCRESLDDKKRCYQDDCVSPWSGWSQCSVSCGQGTQFRSRTCQGNNCNQSLNESKDCRSQPCLNIPNYGPIDGQQNCISRVDRSFDNFSMLKNYESYNQAEKACRLRWDVCDIIVEISRSNGLRKTFEIGSTRVKPCPIKKVQGVQNVKKVWQGHFVGYGPVGQNKCLNHGDRFYDSFSQSKTFESLSLAKIYCQKVHHPSCDIIVEIRRPDFDRRRGELKVVYEIGSTKYSQSNPFCPGRHFLEYDDPFKHFDLIVHKVPILSGWSNWSSCSATCGQGSKTRTRTCSIQGQCYEKLEETSSCYLGQCPTWSNWSSWSMCSLTCGNGSKSRSRTCPVDGACSGRDYDTASCRERYCPTWSQWNSWSLCSVTCGNGSKERTRSCPIQGACRGENYQTEKCQKQKCPTNVRQWNQNDRTQPRTNKGSKSADFQPVKWGFKPYGPANPSDSCSLSMGGSLNHSFKWKQFAKEHCEIHNCDILIELSNGKFEIGSTTSMNRCTLQADNIKQQWIKV